MKIFIWAAVLSLWFGLWGGGAVAKTTDFDSDISILVLDVKGDGLRLTKPGRIYWDIDDDGFAEATTWAMGDGVLAIDRNGDGMITSHREVFGGRGQSAFASLAKLDSNRDGKVDAQDALWPLLVIWVEMVPDGIGRGRELFPVRAIGILALGLSAMPYGDTHGDTRVPQIGSYFIRAGETGSVRRDLMSVNLAYSDINTIYRKAYRYDGRVASLPHLRGLGQVPHLYIAMSIDNQGEGNLLGRVRRFKGLTLEQMLDPQFDLEGQFEAVLFRWAGAEGIDPASRGPHIDARRLVFVEKFMATPFVQTGAHNVPDPLFWAAVYMKKAYIGVFGHLYAALLAQGVGAELFQGQLHYDYRYGGIRGATGINLPKLDEVERRIDARTGDPEERVRLWGRVVRLIEFVTPTRRLTLEEQDMLDRAIKRSSGGLAGLSEVRFAVSDYSQPQRNHRPYILTDYFYKWTRIRLESNLPFAFAAGVVLFFGISLVRAVRRRS